MRSIFSTLASLAVVSLSLAGCAVQSDPVDVDPSTDSQSELTKLTAKYLGTWNYDSTATDTVKFYSQLTLKAGSEYTATKSPACKKGMICPMYLILESGKWSVTPKGELTLKPEGGTKHTYVSSVSADGTGLKLVDSTGHEYFTRLAREGEACGGFTKNPTQCEEGLVCFLGPIPDKGGVCAKEAAEGESCGFRTQTKPCMEGLECVHVSGPLDSLTCAKPATSEGKFCGGIAGIMCPEGYDCVLDGTYPDAGGTCHASPEGQFCGGIGNILCPKGYGCILGGTYPDAGGTCHVCPVYKCAAPPAGCHYDNTAPAGSCPPGCGKLVCDGSGT